MFISHPNNEFWNPLFLGAPGSKHWRALELSNCLPWFILTLQVKEEGFDVERTVLVSWDLDLAKLMEELPTSRLIGLQYVEPPSRGNPGQWRAWPIQTVWCLTDPAGLDADTFIFSTQDGEDFCGTGGFPAPQTASSRRLVARLPPIVEVGDELERSEG